MNLGILGNLGSFATSTVPVSFETIDKEIVDGLQNERRRLDAARIAKDYYEDNVEQYQTDYGRMLGIHDKIPNRRHVPYVRSVINSMVRRMYMTDPARTIPDAPEATEYLQFLYSKARATSKIKDSMKFAALGRVCAIQVELNQATSAEDQEATLKKLRPAVNFRLWSADEFCVWCSPDDPLTPYGVAVIDRYDNQTRIRLWTPQTVAVYTSKKWDGTTNTAGTRIFTQVSVEANFLGLVPFAFTWWTEPTKEFWSWAPGDGLVKANEEANARLSKIADDTLFTRPRLYSRFVREDWKPSDRYQAGDIEKLPSAFDTIGDGMDGPSLDVTMVDLSYLQQDRQEIEAQLEMQADMQGVPKEAWRNHSNNAASGVSIMSEALPVIEQCEERQILMENTERDLAALTLMVVSRWLGEGAMPEVDAAIKNFDLSIQWPSLVKNRPGPDYDQHLQFELVNGLVSEVQALVEMKGITEDQAIEHIVALYEHKKLIAQLSAEVPPPPGLEPIPTEGDPTEDTEDTDETEDQEPIE